MQQAAPDRTAVVGACRSRSDGQAAAVDVSVVIVARDAAADLPAMLESLVAQTFTGGWEVVVVDNRSTDGTADVARSFSSRLPSLKVVAAPGATTKAAALNAVLPAVRGAALITLDADDRVSPGYLTAMSAALEQDDLVGARVDVDALNPPHLRTRREPMQQRRLGTAMRFAPVVIGASMGVRTEALRRVGGFDAELDRLSDMDVSWRLHLDGATSGFAGDAVLHYRYREGLAATFWQEAAYGEGEVALYAKHRSAGVPRRRARTTLGAWLRGALAVRGLLSPAGRYRLATRAGAVVGRVRGSLRHRVLYL